MKESFNYASRKITYEVISGIAGYYATISKNNIHDTILNSAYAMQNGSIQESISIFSSTLSNIGEEIGHNSNIYNIAANLGQKLNVNQRVLKSFNDAYNIMPYALIYGIMDGIYSNISINNSKASSDLYNDVLSDLKLIDPSITNALNLLDEFRRNINLTPEDIKNIAINNFNYLNNSKNMSLDEKSAKILSNPSKFSLSGTIAGKEIAGRNLSGKAIIILDQLSKTFTKTITNSIIHALFVSGKSIGKSLVHPVISSYIENEQLHNRLTDLASILYLFERYNYLTTIPVFVANITCASMSGFVSGITSNDIRIDDENIKSFSENVKNNERKLDDNIRKYNSEEIDVEDAIRSKYYKSFNISDNIAQKFGVFSSTNIVPSVTRIFLKMDDHLVCVRKVLVPTIYQSSKILGTKLRKIIDNSYNKDCTEYFDNIFIPNEEMTEDDLHNITNNRSIAEEKKELENDITFNYSDKINIIQNVQRSRNI